jgi:uncharacterized protein (TIGR04255 family)
MVFPKSPRLIFDNNPLREVIWQLRFPKILSIAAKSPVDFQERIRQRYPLYEAQSGLPAEIATAISQAGIQIESGISHRFRTADGSVIVTLADEFVSVSTGRYREWKELRLHIDVAFNALCEVYKPSFFSRVGLRYVNLIERSALKLQDVPWDKLINAEWLGPLARQELNAHVKEFKAGTAIQLGKETGVAKIRFGLENLDTFRIDSDFFLEGQINGQKAAGIIDDFNEAIGNLFRSAIREPLRDALGPKRAD